LDQLRERHPLELPQGAIDTEVEGMLRDWATDLVRQGADLEQAGIDWEEMRQRMRPDAEARLHARLLLDAVVEADDVTVDDAELDATLARIGRAEGQSGAALRQQLQREGRLDAVRNQIKREKALRSLLGEEPPEAASGSGESADESGDEAASSDEPRNESGTADESSDRGE
jgi:trigger factor